MKQIAGSRRTKRGAEYKLTDPPAADDRVNAQRLKDSKKLDSAGGLSIWEELDLREAYFKCQQCDKSFASGSNLK